MSLPGPALTSRGDVGLIPRANGAPIVTASGAAAPVESDGCRVPAGMGVLYTRRLSFSMVVLEGMEDWPVFRAPPSGRQWNSSRKHR